MYNIEYLITELKAGRSQNIYKSTHSLGRKLIFAVIYWKTRVIAIVSNQVYHQVIIYCVLFSYLFS